MNAATDAAPCALALKLLWTRVDSARVGSTFTWRNVAFGVFFVLWLVSAFSAAVLNPARSGAELTGHMLGAVLLTLGLPMLAWFLYVKRSNRPFWSPWIFVMALVLAMWARSAAAGA